MKKIVSLLMILLMILPFSMVKAEDIALAPSSKSAVLLEVSTGKIIFEKNSHEKLNPASMTKMMSMLLIIEAIENGQISWDEMVTVSENASSMGGSQILLETGEQMSVEDLFKGIAIASGNDAVVALAEKIAGTEELFVQMMNDRAKELGLTDTNFKNPHGLDEANHYSSAYDMSMIAKELVKHEKVLEYTKIYEEYLRVESNNKVWLVNTNKLVRYYDGVDGLKTGYTEEAGYCLTATAKKNNMRVIAVVMGEPDSKTRNSEVSSMLDYMYARYETEVLLSTSSVIKTITVSKAKNKNVELVPMEDATILQSKINEKITATYEIEVYDVKAPIKVGDVVGQLTIKDGDDVIRSIDITVKEDVKKANFIELYFQYVKDILNGDVNV
ncbi:MAG: D-alanyl-D-alanine carboxypeptidase [Bacilli bacterium]|nr:D-alanyl-D-alanine carboxypeptidase [Bacilli bacterium]